MVSFNNWKTYSLLVGLLAAGAMLLGRSALAASEGDVPLGAAVSTSEPGLSLEASPAAQDRQSAVATLVVQVQYVFRTPNLPLAPTRASAVGVQVRAVPADSQGASPAASGVTDGAGTAVLQVPAGSYWVFVPPPADQAPAGLRRVEPMPLPDGTPALQSWDRTTAPAYEATTVTITLDVPP